MTMYQISKWGHKTKMEQLIMLLEQDIYVH